MMASEPHLLLSLEFQALPIHILSLKLGRAFFTKSFLPFWSPRTQYNPHPPETLDTNSLIHSANTMEHPSCFRFWELRLESVVDTTGAPPTTSTSSLCSFPSFYVPSSLPLPSRKDCLWAAGSPSLISQSCRSACELTSPMTHGGRNV